MITLAERVSAFINAEGHLTETDTSNAYATAIRFRSRGLNITATTLAGDDGYLQLACAMILEPDVVLDAPLLRALWECQDRFKCVKFRFDADATLFVCSIETFFAGEDGYQPTFWRAVNTIESAVYAGLSEIRTKCSAKAAAEKFIEELSHGDAR